MCRMKKAYGRVNALCLTTGLQLTMTWKTVFMIYAITAGTRYPLLTWNQCTMKKGCPAPGVTIRSQRTRKKSLEERNKQIRLAKQRNQPHLGVDQKALKKIS